jgi:hypothetical protein
MMVFDAVMEVGRETPIGKPIHLSWVIQISKEGRLLSVDKQTKKKISILQWDRTGTALSPNSGPVETATYAIGLPHPERGGPWAMSRHRSYVQMLEKLSTHSNPDIRCAASSVCSFLSSDGAIEARRILFEEGRAKSNDWVQIWVSGAPDWTLHPDLVAFHQERIDAEKQYVDGKPVLGTCSLCGRPDRTMTRLFGSTKGGASISFNAESTEAYGRTQGFVAPTCLECSGNWQRGLTALMDRDSKSLHPASGVKMCFWAADRSLPHPWDLWDSQWPLPKKETDAMPPSVLLETGGVGHFMVLEKNMGRWAMRRYVETDTVMIVRRLAWWRECFGKRWIGQICEALCGRPRSKGGVDSSFDWISMTIYLHLIGAEPVPPTVIKTVESALMDSNRGAHEKYLHTWRAFLRYVQGEGDVQIREMGEGLEGPARGMWLLGRALRRAEVCQKRRSRGIQRSLSTKIHHFSAYPEDCTSEIVRQTTVRKDGGKVFRDPQAMDLLREAKTFQIPDVPDAELRSAFFCGFLDQIKEDRRRYAAWKAEQDAAVSATK